MNATERQAKMQSLGLVLVNPTTPEPGIYFDVPMQQYLAWDCVSASGLGEIQRSPAHAKAYTEQFVEVGNDDSVATIVGTAAHTAVLESDHFRRRYIRGPDGNWSHKAPKDEVAALRTDNPGCVVLKPAKFDAVLAARDAIFAHPTASQLLHAATSVEVSIVWDDAETGIRCKARPDFLIPDWETIGDLKSAADAGRGGFARAIANFGYNRKAAFYLDGMNTLVGGYNEFAFIAFEKEPPYATAVYELFPQDLEVARRQNRSLLRRWSSCREVNEWPAYPTDITYISLPAWAAYELEA